VPKYLTLAAIVQCAHQGMLQFPPDPSCSLTVGGSEILLRQTFLKTPIAGCTWVGPGKKPCTKVLSLDSGAADEIEISGDVPVLENLRFTTDGNGPPGGQVVSNDTSNAEINGADGARSRKDNKDWNVSNLSWSKSEARDGDEVRLKAAVQGLPDGTPVRATIYEHDEDGQHDYVTRLEDEVTGGQISIPWKFQYVGDVDDIPTHEEAQQNGKSYTVPEYFFTLRIEGRTFGAKGESGLLKFQDFLELQVVDDATGEAIADLEVEITLPDGKKVTRRLDSRGRCRIDHVPPGRCKVVFKEQQ
jgi:hypothetical protein